MELRRVGKCLKLWIFHNQFCLLIPNNYLYLWLCFGREVNSQIQILYKMRFCTQSIWLLLKCKKNKMQVLNILNMLKCVPFGGGVLNTGLWFPEILLGERVGGFNFI